jgi:biopolymer transport protein ExbB/TolQ
MPPPEPALQPGLNKHPPLAPAHVHAALAGGMPGWQIALIAVGAALLAAVLAVLLHRVWAARRSLAARGA